ncbi:MAG: hypothetical protein SFU99_02855 [Saprospiraceae bacterium]|nr:hypothetical protein [Saprospiraceae bacterium]
METFKSFLGGIAATVIGGLLVFYILQRQGFFDKDEPPVVIEEAPKTEIEEAARFSFYNPKLRFYETGDTSIAQADRVYQDSFPQKDVRYINWELEIQYGKADTRRPFHILAIYTQSNGEELSRLTLDTYADKDWDNSFHNWGWGWTEPGNWAKDTYTVALFIGGNEIVKKAFVVY